MNSNNNKKKNMSLLFTMSYWHFLSRNWLRGQSGWLHQTGPRCGHQATSRGEGALWTQDWIRMWWSGCITGGRVGEFCGCHLEHLERKLVPVPREETETVVAGKVRGRLRPSALQPLLASNRPQILFGGNFLFLYSYIQKSTQLNKWQLNKFSQRQHTRVTSPQIKEQNDTSHLAAPSQSLPPPSMVTTTLIPSTKDYFLFVNFVYSHGSNSFMYDFSAQHCLQQQPFDPASSSISSKWEQEPNNSSLCLAGFNVPAIP